jgi:hypothetical protein
MNCENCGQSLGLATTRKKYCSSGCKQGAYRNRIGTPTQAAGYRNTGPRRPPTGSDTGLKLYVRPSYQVDPHAVLRNGLINGIFDSLEQQEAYRQQLEKVSYLVTYDADGYPELPACLDRRKPKLLEAAE